jgi:hypothetical protein
MRPPRDPLRTPAGGRSRDRRVGSRVRSGQRGLPTSSECAYPHGVSAENLSAAADVPRVRVAGNRMRIMQILAAFLIPVAAVVLVLTFSSSGERAPLSVNAQSGSYAAVVDRPLSVTAFRIANTSKSAVTISRIRVDKAVPGLEVIGALAYRGCDSCVTDSAVPPHVTPPIDVAAPPLLGLTRIQLKPGATLTLLLSVRVSRNGRVHVPPLRIDIAGGTGARVIETAPGPELCAGKGC